MVRIIEKSPEWLVLFMAVVLGAAVTAGCYWQLNRKIDEHLQKEINDVSVRSDLKWKDFTNEITSLTGESPTPVAIIDMILYGDQSSWKGLTYPILPLIPEARVKTTTEATLDLLDLEERKKKKQAAEKPGQNNSEAAADPANISLSDTERANAKERILAKLTPIYDEVTGSSAYWLRRVCNGWVQGVTLLFAWVGIFLILFQLPSIFWEKRYLKSFPNNPLHDDEGHPVRDEDHHIIPAYGYLLEHREIQALDDQFGEFIDHLATLRERAIKRGLPTGLATTLYETCQAYRTAKSVDTASRILEERIKIEAEASASHSEWLRYILWAVPSIGFIGTVIGIGGALEKAHGVLAVSGKFAQASSIQFITATLGSAFDTTLVALVCSIFLMLGAAFLARFDDAVRHKRFTVIRDEVLQKFTGLQLEAMFREMMSHKIALLTDSIYKSMLKKELENRRTDYEQAKALVSAFEKAMGGVQNGQA